MSAAPEISSFPEELEISLSLGRVSSLLSGLHSLHWWELDVGRLNPRPVWWLLHKKNVRSVVVQQVFGKARMGSLVQVEEVDKQLRHEQHKTVELPSQQFDTSTVDSHRKSRALCNKTFQVEHQSCATPRVHKLDRNWQITSPALAKSVYFSAMIRNFDELSLS